MDLAHSNRDIQLSDVLDFLIRSCPGRSERQLAEAIFGANGYQQRVNQDCSLLVTRRGVARKGEGGVRDPYTYWPVD